MGGGRAVGSSSGKRNLPSAGEADDGKSSEDLNSMAACCAARRKTCEAGSGSSAEEEDDDEENVDVDGRVVETAAVAEAAATCDGGTRSQVA